MHTKRQLIEETLKLVERLNISLSDKLMQALTQSLSVSASGKNDNSDSDYCDLTLSDQDVDQLVDELFDAETNFAPKGLGEGSEKEARLAREAGRIARVIHEWQTLVTPSRS